MEQVKKFEPEIKKIIDEEGTEHFVAFEVIIEKKNIVVTTSKQIFERLQDGRFKKCDKNKEEFKKLAKILEPPKSSDIIE